MRLLLDEESYDKVTILVRRLLPLEHAKLQQRVIDFDRLDEYVDLIRAHDIFCCLGTTMKKAGSQDAFKKVDFEYTCNVARIASANGAEQLLIVTSLGADPGSRIFYSRVKGNVEEAVANLRFRGVHIFRPSMLLGHRDEFRIEDHLVAPLAKLFSFAMIGRWKKFRAIEAGTVARAMISVAKQNLTGVNVFESDQIQAVGISH